MRGTNGSKHPHALNPKAVLQSTTQLLNVPNKERHKIYLFFLNSLNFVCKPASRNLKWDFNPSVILVNSDSHARTTQSTVDAIHGKPKHY